jgi:putative spermidine/putrescine transport system substrate-binding protein
VLVVLLGACTSKPDPQSPDKPAASAVPSRFAAPTATAVAAVGPTEGKLNLVAPAGYVESGRSDKAIDWVTGFTESTGCTVDVTVADGPDQTARLMATGKYDGVAATGDVSLRLVADRSVAPVNLALVPNAAAIVRGLRGQPYNTVGGIAYGVPQGRSATVLTWRSDQVRPAPTSWNVLYAGGAAYRGKLTTFDSPMTIADAARVLRTTRPDLRVTDPYELTTPQLDAAVALLRVQRGLVSGYWRSYQQVVPALRSGQVVIGATTQAVGALATVQDAKVRSTVPADGTTGSSTTWMLGAKATHPACLYAWMNHLLSPRTNAQAAEWLGLAPAVSGACNYTVDPGWCRKFRATDEAFWAKVAMWRTPLADCRDARGTTCTDYAAWTAAWRKAVA